MFTDRVGRSLDRQARRSAGCRHRCRQARPIPDRFELQAQALGLETARLITLSTALFVGDESLLVDVKGVSEGYPLRGQLQVAPTSSENGSATSDIPAVGEAWMEPRGLRQLDAEVGDIAMFGVHELPISRALVFEPDQGGGPFLLAPRLMVNLDDLLSSELLGAGTRARYRLLAAGDESAVAEFERWLGDEIDSANQTIITAADADDQLGPGLSLTQARRFPGRGGPDLRR